MDNPTLERSAFSISEFCDRNNISASTYCRLRAQGRGPREMSLGRAVRISIEAEQDWKRARELPDDTEARLVHLEREARARSARKAITASLASPKHTSKHVASRKRRKAR